MRKSLYPLLKTKKRLAFLGTILIIASTFSFGQDDHLEPVKDFAHYEGQLKKYYDGVFKLLLHGLSNKPIARYVVLPSWGSEYALSVEKDKGLGFKMVFRVNSTNYWYAKHKHRVKVRTISRSIDTTFAYLIKELFTKVTEQIKQPDENTMGKDGTTYYFSTTNASGQLITGEKWSPSENSNMHRLIQICEELVAFSYNSGKSKEAIIIELNKLLKDL